jgi:Domain of unknown function (DUF5118)
MLRTLPAAFLFALLLPAQQQPATTTSARTPTVEERTTGMAKLEGYFPLYWDERSGNLFLEIPRFNAPFLYVTSLSAGLGSNDIGLWLCPCCQGLCA